MSRRQFVAATPTSDPTSPGCGEPAFYDQYIVGDVLSQNSDRIIADPDKYGRNVIGTTKGVRYNVTTYKGRIARLVPLPCGETR